MKEDTASVFPVNTMYLKYVTYIKLNIQINFRILAK